MKKKRRKVGKQNVVIPADPGASKATAMPEPEKENPFDFGGLPERDLKKNLGCG